ncbi:SCO family protein [Aureimonas mangrovi]|uniref:SCO family protein n=1 Tax=Aureimonas mangrovi TaxID=2758041 RepID=UPI00163DC494|nr:SCO family protein [Aureimonas mangrovi]
MRRARIVLLAGAAIAVLASAYAASLVVSRGPVAGSGGLVSSTGTAAIGGPFSMIDDRGERVTEADLTGKPSVIFFGFTYCPDVCPTTLFELTALMERLGSSADDVNFVMVSVDPERDTPEILHEYVKAFDQRFRGFTGTQEEVDRITEAYKVQVERVETEQSYTMNHTASVYLMDSDNRFFGTISYHEDQNAALAKLERLAGA